MADASAKGAVRALLVEDSPGDVLLLRTMLREVRGSMVALEVRESLAEALRFIAAAPPDVVLLDLGLPDSMGIETFRAVKAAAPGLPVIILTGLADERVAVEAVHEGAQDYIPKGELSGALIHRSILYSIERKATGRDLNERVKELRTLYSVSDMIRDSGRMTPPLIERIVAVLPAGWQYPEAAAARIIAGDFEFKTPGFTPTPWSQAASFTAPDSAVWTVEVVYLREMPESHEGPFLREERALIDSIAQMLRSSVERTVSGEALQREFKANESLAELARDLITDLPVEEISNRVLDIAKRCAESPFGFVGYIDPATGYLVSPTLTRDVWERCRVKEKTIVFHEAHGLFGWVLKNKQPLLTNCASADSRSTGLPEGHIPITRFLSVPAISDGKLIGIVSVANAGRDYDQKDLDLLGRLSILFALAVERQRERDLMEKAELVVENSPTVLFRIAAREGLPIEYVSKNVSRYGYRQEELLALKENGYPSIIHPDDSARVLSEIKSFMGSGADEFRQEFRVMIRSKGACCLWVESRTRLIRGEGGEGVYLQGVLSDITERRESEQKIRQEMELSNRLLAVSEAVADAAGVDELLEQAVEAVRRVMECGACLSYQWDATSGALKAASAAGLDRELTPYFRANPAGRGVLNMARALEGRSSGICAPGALEDRLVNMLGWARGAAVVVLRGTEGLLGAIVLVFNRELPPGFGERERRLLEGVSSQVSTALEKARLHRLTMSRAIELSRKVEIIQTMHEIDRSILSTLDSNEILETAAMTITRLIPCDRVTLFLADRERGGFVYAAGFGLTEPKGSFVPFSETNAAEVAATGEAQFMGDLKETGGLKPFERALAAKGFRSHIRVPLMVKGELTGVFALGSQRPSAFTVDDLLTVEKLAFQIAVALENSRLVTDLEELFIGTVKTLSDAIDAKSPWTRGHSERVTKLAMSVGKALGLSTGELKELELAGLLHDLGKIGTYESILDKPGRLTEEERELIKMRSAKGAEMLFAIKQLRGVIPAIRHHHESFDGQGYSDGLVGAEIPLQARILAVADTFDAMCADRPYRRGKPFHEVVAEIRACSGTQFDPAVVAAFLKQLETEGWAALRSAWNAAAEGRAQ